jgi:hypothetical protein
MSWQNKQAAVGDHVLTGNALQNVYFCRVRSPLLGDKEWR